MTWNEMTPIVGAAITVYANRVKLATKDFAELASQLQRTAGVEQ